MKPLIISHATCLDGAGAALAAYMRFGEDAEYRFAQPGGAPPPADDLRGRDVYVLDLSYPRAVLLQMRETATRVVVIDHHATAQADLFGLDDTVFDMEASGAVLAWHYFHDNPAEAPELIRMIEDRDLWRWKLDGSREVNDAIDARGARTNFRILVEPLLSWTLGWRERLVAEGKAIGHYKQTLVMQLCSNAREVILDHIIGLAALATNTPVLQSEVGGELAIRRPPLGIAWYQDSAGLYRVSLRSSSPNCDVAEMAKARGGGGHRAAAAFSCVDLPWK